MLGNLACFLVIWFFFLKINIFQKINIQEYHKCQTVGSRSGYRFYRAWSGSKLFAKVISRRHWQTKSIFLKHSTYWKFKDINSTTWWLFNFLRVGYWFSLNSLPTIVVCWYHFQTTWTQIRPGITSGLIWIQPVWHSDGILEKNFLKKFISKKSADDKKACKIT